jgi:hypothetical protein
LCAAEKWIAESGARLGESLDFSERRAPGGWVAAFSRVKLL